MVKIDEAKTLEKLEPIIKKCAEALGIIVLETTFKNEGGNYILRIFIYNNTKSVTHEECACLTKLLNKELEETDLIEVPYNLEVSSPGTNRKLKNPIEFEIYKNKKVKVVLKKHENMQFNSNALFGKLIGLTEDQKSLKLEIDNKEHIIDLSIVKITQLDDRDL